MSENEAKNPILEAATKVIEFDGPDGATYRLVADITAAATFFGATGTNFYFEPIGNNPLHHVTLVWAELRTHHPDLAMERIASWFTPQNAPILLALAIKAIREHSFDESQEASSETANPPKA